MKSLLKFLLFVLLLSAGVAALYNLRKSGQFSGAGANAGGARSEQRVPEPYTPAEGSRVRPGDVDLLAELDAQYTKLVEAVVPSVVSISTTRTVRLRAVDPWAQLFYGPRYRGRSFEHKQNSLGSGVIVSKEGHILTNHHVVDGMDEITVVLSDGASHPAKIIGTDKDTDVAVLKVDAKGLVPLPIGDSDKVRVGQLVFAVGNPFGLEETITQGIVSAVGRRTMSDSANEYIQTDTAINPGNSGGPLINLRGEIIGINNHIFSQSGGYQGIGFAIPSNTARRVLEGMIAHGRVVRSWLGVSWQPLTSALAERLGVDDGKGALITEVIDDSPAAEAGLKPGDVIRAVNGRKLGDGMELSARIRELKVGDKAELKVLRNRQEQQLVATIGEMPENPAALLGRGSGRTPGPQTLSDGVLRGVSVRELTPQFAQRLGLPQDALGVVVTQIEPGTPAAEVLEPGDVIQGINHTDVRSLSEYEDQLQSLDPAKPVMLYIARRGTRSFVVVSPE
jgi:serine protease Do